MSIASLTLDSNPIGSQGLRFQWPLPSIARRPGIVVCSIKPSASGASLSVASDPAASEGSGRIDSLSQVSGVLGCQWGDEGKGKLVDILAQHFDIVARCQVVIFSATPFVLPLLRNYELLFVIVADICLRAVESLIF